MLFLACKAFTHSYIKPKITIFRLFVFRTNHLPSVPVRKINFPKRTFISRLFPFTCKGFHSSSSIFSSSKQTLPARSEINRLLSVAKVEKWTLSGAVLLLLVSSAVTMSVPFCVGKLIDIMVSPEQSMKSNLILVCQILVAVFAVGAASNFGRVYLISMSSQRIINDLRKRAYSSILCQETAFFDQSKTGELINRLSADTTTVGISITNNISDGLRSFFSFVASSSLMIYTSPQLASLALVTVAPVAGVAVIFGKTLKKNSKHVQDALANATQVAEERISNIRTVQTFLKINVESKLFQSKIDSIMHFAKKESLSRAIFFCLTGFSGNLIILSVLYYGGQMMNENLITIGGLSSFLLYAAYVGVSIGGLSTFYSELMRGLGASSRLWEIIERKPLIPVQGGVVLPSLQGEIDFRNITFAYPTRPDSPVLSDFNLKIPAGSVFAIVGSSGCGKSTVGSVLLRLYDCQKGSVFIDNHDIKSLNLQWFRKNIGVVSQEPVLFSFSVKENVMYGVDENSVDDREIEGILQKANALDFVKTLPKGLDTVVGERGVMLSGGQRQRLAIARALLKNPKILILDEATSALDAESEYLVQRALDDLMKSRTVITIAHRLSTVRKADMIVVLESGKIIEQGSYNELVSMQGAFYRLVQRQNLKSF